MGYWIVVGMIVCAFGMVIIALSADVASIPDPKDEDGRRNPESDRDAPKRSQSEMLIRWTALVPTGIAQPWPVHTDAAVWGPRPTIVALSDPSIAGIRSAVMSFPDSALPHIVSMQVGLVDLLSGTARGTFIAELTDVLDLLRRRNVVAVVGDIPDLSRLVVPGRETFNPDSLRRLTEDWNTEISRSTQTFGADLVDLFDVPLAETSENVGGAQAESLSTRLDQPSIAAGFRPAIESAIRIASLQATDSS